MRNISGYFCFCILFVLALTSCSQRDNNIVTPTLEQTSYTAESSELTRKTIIKLAVDDGRLRAYQQLAAEFEATHPEIHVSVIGFNTLSDSDSRDIYESAAREADLFSVSSNFEINSNYVLDLKPFFDTDPTFNPADFHAGLLDNSVAWFIPTAVDYPVIFYSKLAFLEAGLDEPVPGWTMDDFLASAQTLTVREGNDVVRWGYVPNGFNRSPLLTTQLSGPLLQNGAPRLTDADVVTSAQWFADLFTTHQVSPWLPSYDPTRIAAGALVEQWDLMNSDDAAMWQREHTLWKLGNYDDRIGVVTVPTSANGYAADPLVTGFAISRGTQHADAAWQLVDFLSRQPPFPTDEYLVPARRSVAAGMNYWESLPNILQRPLLYAVEHNQFAYSPPGVSIIASVLTDMIQNGTDAELALAAAEADIVSRPIGADSSETFVVPTAVSETAVTQIQYALSWSQQPAHQLLANAFEKENPEIEINVSPEISIRDADCFSSFVLLLPHIQTQTELLPLDPFFEVDPTVNRDDFYPGTFDLLTQNAQTIGLPGWIDVPYIEYNRTIFDRLGLEEPTPDWTIEEFLQIADALTNENLGRYGFVDWANRSLMFGFTQFGIDPIQGDTVESLSFDFLAVEPVLRWYTDLVTQHGVQPILPSYIDPPSGLFDHSQAFDELILEEKAVMWLRFNSNIFIAEKLAQSGADVGIVPLPKGPSGYNINLGDAVTGYYISASTPHRQICWDWITFLTKQSTASNFLPARIDVAESAQFAAHIGSEYASYLPQETEEEEVVATAFGDRVAPERVNAYRNGVLYSSDDISISASLSNWLSPSWDWLRLAYQQVVTGNADVNTALMDASQRFESYRACIIERNGFYDDDVQEQCAGEADERLAAYYDYLPDEED